MPAPRIPAELEKEFATFPAALRKLVLAEIKAGNRVTGIEHGFPAAPCGASVRLARAARDSRRKSSGDVQFFARNTSSYAGEFTTAERHFFVLEPPAPPPAELDMNALRAEREAKQRAADAELYRAQQAQSKRAGKATRPGKSPGASGPGLSPAQFLSQMDAIRADLAARERASDEKFYSELYDKGSGASRPQPTATPRPKTAVDLFRESMVCTYERWREGIGYDLALLKTATPEELVEIEELLLPRCTDDWRDVEALAALNSPRARVALKRSLKTGKAEIKAAVLQYAPDLVPEAERTAALVKAIDSAAIYGGLSQTLMLVEASHPPAVIDALLRGALASAGENATHFAAMLMFLHGKAKSAFDWDHRPFFLRFNTDDRAARKAVFRELCTQIGVSAEKYLGDSGR